VAGLAELGDLAEEKLGVIAAVGRMATQAILIDRGVLPHERAAFFRMALIAELIGGAGFDHVFSEPAVMVVAVRALHFPFADRMVGLLVLLRPDGPVADVAKIRLSGFQIFPGSGMNGVAVVAGNIRDFVPALGPEGKVFGVPVAGKTFCRFGIGIGDLFAVDKNPYPALSAFFHMRGSRSVAGFAGILACRAVGDPFFSVGGFQIALVVILMASFADLRPDDALAAPDIS
jgi:hypothetical protein